MQQDDPTPDDLEANEEAENGLIRLFAELGSELESLKKINKTESNETERAKQVSRMGEIRAQRHEILKGLDIPYGTPEYLRLNPQALQKNESGN